MAGGDPERFWDMTARTVTNVLKAAKNQAKELWRQKITAAWCGANWTRAKEMPSLNEVLGDDDEQSSRQQEVRNKHNAALWRTVIAHKFGAGE
jgi:hypothetical protein